MSAAHGRSASAGSIGGSTHEASLERRGLTDEEIDLEDERRFAKKEWARLVAIIEGPNGEQALKEEEERIRARCIVAAQETRDIKAQVGRLQRQVDSMEKFLERINKKHAAELRTYLTSDARAATLKVHEELTAKLKEEALMLRARMNEVAVREDVDADGEGQIAEDKPLGGQDDDDSKTYDCVVDFPEDVFMDMLESGDMSFLFKS